MKNDRTISRLNLIYDAIGFAVVVAVGIWSMWPLLNEGFFPMHDDTQVARVIAMGRSLRDGQFPVRWVSDLGYGYGYPIFNFYAPLPYYVGGLFHLLGLSGLTATKWMFLIGQIASGVTFMWVLRRYVGKTAAVFGAFLYLLAPYHAVDWYVRGAVGEAWAFVFLPLVLRGVMAFWDDAATRRISAVAGVVGIAGAVLSHTLLGFVTAGTAVGVLGIGILWRLQRARTLQPFLTYVLSVVVFGLGFSAFFWLPALSEMKYTAVAGQIGGSADFGFHFVCTDQLWSSPWGFGGSGPGCVDGMSFKVGKIHVVLAVVGALWLFLKGRQNVRARLAGVFALVIVGVSLLMLVDVSQAVWQNVAVLAYLQYPWRFLTYTAFGVSLLGAMSLLWIPKYKLLVCFVMGALLLWEYLPLFQPQFSYEKNALDFERVEELRYRASKVSDEYLSLEVPRPQNSEGIVTQGIVSTDTLQVNAVIEQSVYGKYVLSSETDQPVLIRRFAFPGWSVHLNGVFVSPTIREGQFEITIPAGIHALELSFFNTAVRNVANLISCIALGLFVLYISPYGKKIIS